MSEVKIGVSAGAGNVSKAVDQVTASLNRMGAAVAKSQGLKFEDTSAKLLSRDLALINKQFQQAITLSANLRNALKNTGQSGKGLADIDFSKLNPDPKVAQRMRDRAFSHAVQGTSLDPTLANDVDAEGRAVPFEHKHPRAERPTEAGGGGRRGGGGGGGGRAAGGFGRGIGKIFRGGLSGAGGAVEAAGSGAMEGAAGATGLLGGLGGMVGGGLLGLGAFGAYKAVSGLMDGISSAKAQDLDIDSLKRQLGDLGISFNQLRTTADSASKGLGLSTDEFTKLEDVASQASGGAYRTPDALADATRSGAGLSRAYGLDPSAGAGFVGGMDRLNPRQNNKELAVMLAEAIRNSSGKALPAEVMQAMQGFASAQNRKDLSNPDMDRFGNAFSSLLGVKGMTAENAASTIGTANSAVQGMGGSEAGQNFTMRAFGGLDPIQARIRAEGGIFATNASSFSDSDVIGQYMKTRGVNNWGAHGAGPGSDVTNFHAINSQFDTAYAGKGEMGAEMELDAQKNYWHLNSYKQTAAFVGMDDSQHNGLMKSLKSAGVDLNTLNESGMQTLASIGGAKSMGDLNSVYKDMLGRTGKDALSDSEKAALAQSQQTGNFGNFQKTLTQVGATHGQEDTPAKDARDAAATLKSIETGMGRALYPPLSAIQGDINEWVGKALPIVEEMGKGIDGIAKFFGVNASSKPVSATTGSGAPYGFGSGGGPVSLDPRDYPIQHKGAYLTDTIGSGINYAYGKSMGAAYGVRDDVSSSMKQLIALGADPAHAAAIVASAARESSMNPDAKNGDHYGLFQLDKGRQADYLKVMGKDVHGSSVSDQMAYMMKSLKAGGEEEGPGKEFWASNGADASGVFATKVERTDHAGKESEIRSAMANSILGMNGYTDKVPASDRAASDRAASAGAASSGGAALYGPAGAGDITINFEQHNTSASGGTKTSRISTTIAKPSSSGVAPTFKFPSSN